MANFKTSQQMRDAVLNELVLVTGTSVQTYTEPMLYDYFQRAFDHYFTKRYWNHLTTTTFHTLAGTGGDVATGSTNVITDNPGINSWEDILWVRYEPYRPDNIIEAYDQGVFDTVRRAWQPLPYGHVHYADRVITFSPLTLKENVAIRARRRPADFVPTDIIPLDDVMLIHWAAGMLLATDGLNPEGQRVQLGLAEDRYISLIAAEGDTTVNATNNRWRSDFTVAS